MKMQIKYVKGVEHYYLDGREVDRAEYMSHVPKRTGSAACFCRNKVKLSEALAVHPSQIKEAMEHDRKRGIASEYAPDGRMIVQSRQQQKEICKMLNYHNKSEIY